MIQDYKYKFISIIRSYIRKDYHGVSFSHQSEPEPEVTEISDRHWYAGIKGMTGKVFCTRGHTRTHDGYTV